MSKEKTALLCSADKFTRAALVRAGCAAGAYGRMNSSQGHRHVKIIRVVDARSINGSLNS